MLESPRQVEGQPKSVVFDAQIYQGLGQQPLVAHLHYFNKYNMSFLDDVGVYFLHAMVICPLYALLSHLAKYLYVGCESSRGCRVIAIK